MSSNEELKKVAEAKKIAGNSAFSAKDYPEAIRLYSEAIDLDGSNHVYYSNRSACYAALGQYEKAKSDAEKCISCNEYFLKGYYRLSIALQELDDIDGALKAVSKGLSVDATNADLIKQKRTLQSKKKDLSKSSSGTKEVKQLDKQTFQEMQEIQEQIDSSQREHAEVSATLQTCIRDQRRAQLTKSEIDSFSSDTRLYRSIGRLFMLNSHEEIQRHITDTLKEKKDAEEKLKGKKTYLEKKIANQRSTLNELIGVK